MPITVEWNSTQEVQAEVWRVLDLSGMTKTHRESRNSVLSKLVYLNGNRVETLKDTVPVGSTFTLEIRYNTPEVNKKQEIFLTSRQPVYKQRYTKVAIYRTS